MVTPNRNQNPLVEELIRYYRERSAEFDDWFFRLGRYDRGEETNARWFAEVEEVRDALDKFKPQGRVLELAAGTGLWTERLLKHADHVTAVDSSPEVLDLCRKRAGEASARLTTIQADLFDWLPESAYDVVFFSFWLSHVPEERFAPFWEMVRTALVPGGRVFLMDSKYTPESTAKDHLLGDEDAGVVERKLNDGRSFKVVKVFYTPEALAQRLDGFGWNAAIGATNEFFLFGNANPK